MSSNNSIRTAVVGMKRVFCLFLTSVLLGLVWNMGSDFGLIFIHLIAPCFQGIVAATLLGEIRLKKRLSVLLFSVVLTNLVRVTTYFYQGGALALRTDGETRLVVVLSFLEQVLVAIFVGLIVIVVGKFLRRKRNAQS